MIEPGELIIDARLVDLGRGSYYEITGARLEGQAVVIIDDWVVNRLPAWARSMDGRVVQIGAHIWRRTELYEPQRIGHYWYMIGGGEVYYALWRAARILDGIYRRLILTLAIWGLAAWPLDGAMPSWGDVHRRWAEMGRRWHNGRP